MRTIFALGLLVAIQAAAPAQENETPSFLNVYLNSLHWDAAKSGALIAVAPEGVWSPGPAADLAAFGMKMEKVGGVSVIALNWSEQLNEAELPNAYQELDDHDKVLYLLATLTPSNLSKLTGPGISPSDLQGDQRAALLSMFPRPFTVVEGVSTGNGYESHSMPFALTADQVSQVKLQFQKTLIVNCARTTRGSSWGFSNISYRGPVGTKVMSRPGFLSGGNPLYPAAIVESAEKKSQINWNDPKLATQVALTDGETIGKIVDSIRDASGVEVYADARNRQLKTQIVGDHGTCADVLRGLTIALAGVVRKVGPAYVLTSDLEGEGSREGRLYARKCVGRLQLDAQLDQWRDAVASRNLLASVGFGSDDSLQANSIPSQDLISEDGRTGSKWISLNELPKQIGDALAAVAKEMSNIRTRGAEVLDPNFEGKVSLTCGYAYRLILPNGMPLEANNFDPEGQSIGTVIDHQPPRGAMPLDPTSFKKGFAVCVKSDDPGQVADVCKQLKSLGIGEIYVQSQNRAAFQTAIDSGLSVNVLIHPWQTLKGERPIEPDRNIIGQTVAQLNKISDLGLNPVDEFPKNLEGNFSPGDPNLGAHWQRILAPIPTKGVHQIVLMDGEQDGYQGSRTSGNGYFGTMIYNGVREKPSLRTVGAPIYEFGYTEALRLKFLRTHGIDPVDILNPNQPRFFPLPIYFEQDLRFQMPTEPNQGPLRPSVILPQLQDIEAQWFVARNQAHEDGLALLEKQLSPLCDAVYIQRSVANAAEGLVPPRIAVDVAQDPKISASYDSAINFALVSPETAFDETGHMNFKIDALKTMNFCLDLEDVPFSRIPEYLRYAIKSAEKPKT